MGYCLWSKGRVRNLSGCLVIEWVLHPKHWHAHNYCLRLYGVRLLTCFNWGQIWLDDCYLPWCTKISLSSIGLWIHHLALDWNIATTIGWNPFIFCTDAHVAQRLNSSNLEFELLDLEFDEPLFPVKESKSFFPPNFSWHSLAWIAKKVDKRNRCSCSR